MLERRARTVRLPALAALLGFGLAGCVGEMPGADDAKEPRGPATPGVRPEPDVAPGVPMPSPVPIMPGGTPMAASAGRAPVRRLTAEQYANTVRDLLRLSTVPPLGLGGDEAEAGYAANAVVSVNDLQVEQYRDAAELLAGLAMNNPGALSACAANPGTAEATCAQEFITQFGKRAFRRPLEPVEVQRYRDHFIRARMGATFSAGLGAVVEAMLQSPHFLYRFDLGAGSPDATGSVALTPYEVASRLSYLLWSSMPDDVLFAAADAGKLKTPEEIEAQAARLLKHPNARRSVVSFHEQWLDLNDFDQVEKDPDVYPSFTPELKAALREEVQRFVEAVVRADGTLETLLTSTSSALGGPLFAHYGLPAATNKEWRSVTLPAGQRSGLLTLAGVQAVHAHAAQSSLVARGVLIRQNLLCTKLPTPPPGVDDNPPAVSPNATSRQRFAAHRKDPGCASCHALMDPLGEPFEAYDGIGRFRTKEGNNPVDTSGHLSGTAGSDGPVKDPLELAARLAGAKEVRQCVTRQWFRFAFGREEVAADAATLAAMYDAFEQSGFKISGLLVGMTSTKGFTHRQATP